MQSDQNTQKRLLKLAEMSVKNDINGSVEN